MGLMEKFFGKSAAITSAMIRAEIDRAQDELTATRTELSTALGGIAVMSDSEHQKADERAATLRRAVARFEAKIAGLESELPAVVAAEEVAATAAANEALRQRAEAARKSVNKEAAALLREYDTLAAKIGDILARLDQIAAETNNVNQALRVNPVAESVAGYDSVHRAHPAQEASEQREMRPCWVYPDGTVRECTDFDDRGQPITPHIGFDRATGAPDVPRLVQREVVVSRTHFRPGHHEVGLSNIVLPPGFIAGAAHWPRKS